MAFSWSVRLMPIDEAPLRRNQRRGAPLTGAGRRPNRAPPEPMARAQVAELVDALASGASGLTAVKVRVLSWAPSDRSPAVAGG